MRSAAFLFVVFVAVGPSDLGLCLTGALTTLTFAYNTQVERSTETTPFDLALTRPQSGLALPGTVPQDDASNTEGLQTPVQYKCATPRKLRDALERTRVELTAAQRRYKTDFDRKVRFRPFIAVGDVFYVDLPPRPLTSTERGELPSDGGASSVKLLPKTEGPFRVRSATESTVVVDQTGISNRVSINRVTQMLRGPHDANVAAPITDTPAGIPELQRNTWLTTWSPTGRLAAAASTRSTGTVSTQRKILGNPSKASRNPSSTASGARGKRTPPLKPLPDRPGADGRDTPPEGTNAAVVKETLGRATSHPSRGE